MNKLFHRGRILAGTTLLSVALVSGCGDSENFVFTNTAPQPTPPVVADAPVAQNDAFNALGNATLNQAASGILANDTLNGATITEFDAVGSQGGTINLSQDGSFTYTPVVGFVGAETFNYTITNETGSSTATVTLTSTGFGRFVDNSAPAGGTGTQGDPFDTLAEAVAVAQPGDTIFVARGNGTNSGMTGGLTLPQGVNFIGQGSGLILGQIIVPAGQAPVIQGPIRPLGDNTISGITLDGTADEELIEISSASNIVISNCTLRNPNNGDFIEAVNVGGQFTVGDCTFQSPADDARDYIDLDNTDTNADIVVTDNVFLNAENNSIDKLLEIFGAGTSVLEVEFSRNTADGTQENQFVEGLYVGSDNKSSVICSDNVLSNFSGIPMNFERAGPVTVSENTITDCGARAIYLDEPGSPVVVSDNIIDVAYRGLEWNTLDDEQTTATISGNVISNTTDDGINIVYEDGTSTFVISNNNISNAGDDGIELYNDEDDHDSAVALRNNNILNCDDEAVEVDWFGQSGFDICLEIIGNIVNDDVYLSQVGDGLINVEQAALVGTTLNDFQGNAEFDRNDDATSVSNGFCAIP